MAVFPAVIYGSVRWRSICVHVAGIAVFFHFVSVVEMLVQAHRWMPVGGREIESLLGFAIVGLFFLVWWLYDAVSFGIFALPGTFLLVLAPALGPGRYIFHSSTARASWLVAHIAALLLAYAALCFSLLASVLYLVQERRIRSKPRPGRTSLHFFEWLPALDTLERIAYATLEFGFPCMTVGLALGAVLVQESSVGATYFFDPRVVASFVCWFVYVVLLLVRRGAGLRGRRAAYVSGAAIVVLMAVWVANLFSQLNRFGPR
ncbi:MAG: cytochrome c biogenesis protein CcsA [Acidobacteriota bacterium]